MTLKAKPHLIVIFSKEIEANIIDEFYKTGVPILSFNCNFLNNSKITYKILGNFNLIKRNLRLTYFFLFYSILKKAPLKKNKRMNINKKKRRNESF